ncbi:MAG: hypothetical protein K0R17_2744 [Rariglobus sp.]|jgi:hypothetical protein|nr:hypothetical protein [Rariglobus sp.]
MSSNHEERIAGVLRSVTDKEELRGLYRGKKGDVTNYTPLSALLAAEDGEDDEELMRARMEVFNRFIDFCVQDGAHPGAVMRNFYAIVHALRPEALRDLTCEEYGKLFGETKQAHSWRVKQIFSGYMRKQGAGGFKARFQKSETAVESYRRVRLGKKRGDNQHKKAA